MGKTYVLLSFLQLLVEEASKEIRGKSSLLTGRVTTTASLCAPGESLRPQEKQSM